MLNLASGLALLSVSPTLFIEDTRLGLVSPEFSPEFDPKFRSMSGISECGEVTIPNESQSSIFTSPVDGISIIDGLVSCLLDPPCSFKPASEPAVWFRLNNEFLDSAGSGLSLAEMLEVLPRFSLFDWRFFLHSDTLFDNSPNRAWDSGLFMEDSPARPVKPLEL